MRPDAAFEGKYNLQESLLELPVEDNVLVDDVVAVERIFQAIGVKWSGKLGWRWHKSLSLRPVPVYLSKREGRNHFLLHFP